MNNKNNEVVKIVANATPLGATNISPDFIRQNPENPRLVFPEKEMRELQESIFREGVLVALVVYEESPNDYVILDGERRWISAKKLNLETIPVNIIAKPDKIGNILQMFNIHNVREEWELMPTALKLKEIMELRNVEDDKDLAGLTNLQISTVKRCKILLTLPEDIQKLIMDEKQEKPKKDRIYTEDFFLEMISALNNIKKYQNQVYTVYSGDEEIIRKFIEKKEKDITDKSGTKRIANITHFRNVSKIAKGTKEGAADEKIKKILFELIDNVDLTIEEAFELSVRAIYQATEIEKKADILAKDIASLNFGKQDVSKRATLIEKLIHLRDIVNSKLNELSSDNGK